MACVTTPWLYGRAMNVARHVSTIGVVGWLAAPSVARGQSSVAQPAPVTAPAVDSASVSLVMRAVLEKLAPLTAEASVADRAVAWEIRTPAGGGPYWDRAHAWLVAALHADTVVTPTRSRRLVLVHSAVIRGDTLVASFLVGAAHPGIGRSPSTTYELRAGRIASGWGAAQVRATLFVD